MLISTVSPTAHHATRFACLFLRSNKVATNTETVLALWGRPGAPHQGRLNLWLCLVLNTQGLTHPLPPLPLPLVCLNLTSCGQRLMYGLEIREPERAVFGTGIQRRRLFGNGIQGRPTLDTNSRGSREDRFVPGDPEKTPKPGGSRDDLRGIQGRPSTRYSQNHN
jgi:hypothetical protein